MTDVRYADSAGVKIAYRVVSEGDRDLIFIPGFVSNLDFEPSPSMQRVQDRLAGFSRLIMFDKRGSGLSDPIDGAPTFDQRMDDLTAVLDAVGSERATLLGFSEGGPAAVLFAATHPDRVSSLILYGAMARGSAAPDYPYAAPADVQLETGAELLMPYWGQGAANAEIFTPSVADDPDVVAQWARLERMASSPAAIGALYSMFVDIDVRGALPAITVPTLVLHKRGDRVVSIQGARWMAEQIPGARLVEFDGIDHSWLAGENVAPILDEIEAFVTGHRTQPAPERVLATVMFTDIVGSTERAAELGDARWHELLDTHHRITRDTLGRFRGTEVKSTGDGFLATFDGPGRAVSCAHTLIEELRGARIEIRVGLHAGEVELIDAGDIGGIAVHIAARIGTMAGPSQALVSETVKGLVAGSGLAFSDEGEHELKGIPDRWRLFSALPPG